MKSVILARHAKTEHVAGKKDFDRDLTKRGVADAELMAETIKSSGHAPDLILASNAVRAARTAEIMSESIGCPAPMLIPDFYGCAAAAYIQVITAVENHYESVCVIAHDPTITEAVERFCSLGGKNGFSVHVPTGGMALIEFCIDDWRDFRGRDGVLRWFITPKILKKMVD